MEASLGRNETRYALKMGIKGGCHTAIERREEKKEEEKKLK